MWVFSWLKWSLESFPKFAFFTHKSRFKSSQYPVHNIREDRSDGLHILLPSWLPWIRHTPIAEPISVAPKMEWLDYHPSKIIPLAPRGTVRFIHRIWTKKIVISDIRIRWSGGGDIPGGNDKIAKTVLIFIFYMTSGD